MPPALLPGSRITDDIVGCREPGPLITAKRLPSSKPVQVYLTDLDLSKIQERLKK